MKILAIETATEACSVALTVGGERFHRHQVAPRRHAELVLPLSTELLDEAAIDWQDLDGVAVSRGPGAFTGVRIGISMAQSIALAADIVTIPISTLGVLAQSVGERAGKNRIVAAIDARMGEVYWGLFQIKQGLLVACGEEAVCKPQDLEVAWEGAMIGVGSGFDTYGSELTDRFGERLIEVEENGLPCATDLLALAEPRLQSGETVLPEDLVPQYVRNKVVN